MVAFGESENCPSTAGPLSVRKVSELILMLSELLLLMFFCVNAFSQHATSPDSATAAQQHSLWSLKKACKILHHRVSIIAPRKKTNRTVSDNTNVIPSNFLQQFDETRSRLDVLVRDVRAQWQRHLQGKLSKSAKKLSSRTSQRRRRHMPLPMEEEDAFEEKDREAEANDVPGPPYVPPPDPLGNLSVHEANGARRSIVVEELRNSWAAYVRHAWGSDELRPLSRSGRNWSSHGGVGLTIVDAASTMYMTGLKEELESAIKYIENELSFNVDADMSQFEATIRLVGGILSLYELTGESHPKLLERAEDIARRLLHAYETPTMLPDTTVNLLRLNHSNPKWRQGCTAVAEITSVQLEFRSLSFHTRNPEYDSAATGAFFLVHNQLPHDSLPRILVNVSTGAWVMDYVSVGALGDSYYEYLLKQYLLTNRTQNVYKIAFKQAVRSLIQQLLLYSNQSRLAFFGQRVKKKIVREWDHLACFFGGTLALGAQELDLDEIESAQWMSVADEIVETCFQMYARQQTGLSPEFVVFPETSDFVNGNAKYLLRPETMESLFYMWRFTKNQKYRDYGWRIFRSLQQFCRLECGGYSGLRNVNVLPVKHDDLMQSFWLAETLKYAFLLFSDETLDLRQWVLNTEGHPLRIRNYLPLGFSSQNVQLPRSALAHHRHRRSSHRHRKL